MSSSWLNGGFRFVYMPVWTLSEEYTPRVPGVASPWSPARGESHFGWRWADYYAIRAIVIQLLHPVTLVFVRRNYVARAKYCRPPTALREIQRICKSSTFNTFSNSICVHALVVLMGVVHFCCPPWLRKGSIIGNCVLLFSLRINREKLQYRELFTRTIVSDRWQELSTAAAYFLSYAPSIKFR